MDNRQEQDEERLYTVLVLQRVSQGMSGEDDALFLASKLGLRSDMQPHSERVTHD
jgi:hypothetical protein